MTIAFITLGCKVNHYETEALQNLFKAHGYHIKDKHDFADIYVINTCTVTNQSDSKSRKMIRRVVKKNPDAIVAVIGCYAQVDHETIATIDGVDIIMGTTDRSKLLNHIERFKQERKQILAVKDITRYKVFDKLNVSVFEDNTRAFIKIQDGCDEFCSYCIIPFARGRVRSRDKAEIIQEAKNQIKNGFKEIVLTGIHTGGYAQDLEGVSFYDLLKALSDLDGLKRLRISSIEINQLTPEIINLMKTKSVFAKHLHIPLQHGSDNILKDMRRRYDTKTYLDKLNHIRNALGDIAITTDIIVGYPGETDDDFNEMKNTIKAAGFSELHVFPYSKRSGTKAAQIKNQVHGTIKSVRMNELLRLNETLASQFQSRKLLEDKTLDVLIERCRDGVCHGYTSEYIYLNINTESDLTNTINTVKLTDVSYPDSKAVIVK